MSNPKSILPAEMRGVQKITGYRGRGKSFYSSQVENPTLTAFFDFEKKGEGIDSQLHFGMYVPVTELASGDGGLGVWDVFVREAGKNMPAGKYTHVILDNTAPLETAMKAEAARHADVYAGMFGMDAGNIRANRYGAQSGVVNYMISERICNPFWSKGVKLITVTSHIKPRWSGGAQVPNSYNIKGADRWDELSILTLVMIPGDFPPVSSALVMKEQLGKLEWNERAGKFKAARRLPYRLPTATPAAVYEYLEHPADLEHPKEGESPREDEITPFQEKLSREQLSIVLAEIESNKAEEKELAEFARKETLSDTARKLMSEKPDIKLPELARALGVSPIEAKRLMNNGGDKE